MNNDKKMIAMQLTMASDWEAVRDEIEQLTSEYLNVDFASDHWEQTIEEWCQKALGLDDEEFFLLNWWRGDFNNGVVYNIKKVKEDIQYIRMYAPTTAEIFDENSLMEYRNRLEKLVFQYTSY